jgi:hypothetical protein
MRTLQIHSFDFDPIFLEMCGFYMFFLWFFHDILCRFCTFWGFFLTEFRDTRFFQEPKTAQLEALI